MRTLRGVAKGPAHVVVRNDGHVDVIVVGAHCQTHSSRHHLAIVLVHPLPDGAEGGGG